MHKLKKKKIIYKIATCFERAIHELGHTGILSSVWDDYIFPLRSYNCVTQTVVILFLQICQMPYHKNKLAKNTITTVSIFDYF